MDKAGLARWDWADKFMPAVRRIIKENAGALLDVVTATPEQDQQECTDLIIRLKAPDVAVRIRRPGVRFRDLTLRASVPSGAPTELEKLLQGHADVYFFGWAADTGEELADWMIADLNALRCSGLLIGRSEIPSGDGGTFIAIPRLELEAAGCLIARKDGAIGR